MDTYKGEIVHKSDFDCYIDNFFINLFSINPINLGMKWLNLIAILMMFLSIKSFALDDYEYDEMLEKHLTSGHLTNLDIDRQKFEMINSKKYHQEFSKQVRGVASKLNDSKDVLKFINPEIDLSEK